MKNLLFLCVLSLSFSVLSQNYPIGHTTIMFEDPDRGNRQIQTEIYYPATVAGEDTPGANGEFPVIVFGHGFVMVWSAYENLWEEFVSRGYIMAFPRTEGNAFSTDHQKFGWDLQFLVTAMQQEGNDPASMLHQIVAPETALMGHSMGGGAAFLAADSLVTNGNTNLKTLIGLAPAESSSNGVSSISSATQITLPSLILSGVQDGVTPPVDHHIPMYNNLASDCKTIIHIIGGAHCYFANSNTACDFGESTSSSGISITRQEQHQVTFDFVNQWLDYTLKADCNDFTVFNDSLTASPRITFDQVCNGPITFESSESVTICQGSTYTFPDGTTSSTATTHLSTLSSVGGCDSIVETTLQVNNSYNIAENITVCQGTSYTFPDGTIGTTTTNHTSNLTTVNGCDSIIETTLIVNDTYSSTETVTACQGTTYTFPDGTTSSSATVHTSILTSSNGCDSIIETTLQFNTAYNLTETASICQGGAYTFPDGTTSSIATTHTSNLTTVNGCDSIIETTLQINDSYNVSETATICQGSFYTFPDGTTSSSATTHTSNLTTVNGCDSIVETTLQVTNSYNLSETASICQGGLYTFPDGTTSSSPTVHTSTLTSVGGCDSIIETTLEINDSYNLTESATICQGGAYTFPDGTTSSTATTHTSNLTTVNGCDSIIETTLQVNNSYSLTESATICQGGSYTFPDGTTSSTSTTHTSMLTTVNGCDSIIVTSLLVNNAYNLSESAAICQGGSYTFPDGTTSTSSTTHTSFLTTVDGCDSIIETVLDVQPIVTTTENISICQGGTYTFPDGTTSSTATTHTSVLTSQLGCDSLVETTLQVVNAFNLTENATICQGGTYTFPDGTTSTTSTTHTSSLTSVGGCDSIIETTLLVTDTYSQTESVTICQGGTYTFPDGTTSSTSTTHTSNLTTIYDCDSTIETTLTVITIDTNVTTTSSSLVANQTGATYQWIDCNDNSPIAGETNATFEPQGSGDFAVIISLDGCTSISNCHSFQTASIEDETNDILFKLYPNPTSGNIKIESNLNYTLEIYDAKGSIVHQSEISVGENSIVLTLNPGLYIWKATTKNQSKSGKLVLK